MKWIGFRRRKAYLSLLNCPELPRLLIVTLAVYPHLVLNHDFTRKLNFPYKVDPLNLESQNKTKNIPVVLPSSPIKILRQIGQEVQEL